jgi:hypothetical protein
LSIQFRQIASAEICVVASIRQYVNREWLVRKAFNSPIKGWQRLCFHVAGFQQPGFDLVEIMVT